VSIMRKASENASILRRPSDFQGQGQITLFNGCCCCCCCLHWIGAAIGGLAGIGIGSSPPLPGVVKHRRARRNSVIGGLCGLLVTIAVMLMNYVPVRQSIVGVSRYDAMHVARYVGISLILVPCSLFVPVWLGMLAGAWVTPGSAAGQRGPSGYGCTQCGYDLRGSLEQARCPECGMPFDPSCLPTRLESKYRLARRAGGLGLLLSLIGTAVGYLFMAGVCFSR